VDEQILIHPSLHHFFVMLWLVHKIEHVIRNYTRWWLEQRTDASETIEHLCNVFKQDDKFLSELHMVFQHAVSHVEKSIVAYVAQGPDN
jgi:hypothetical protein